MLSELVTGLLLVTQASEVPRKPETIERVLAVVDRRPVLLTEVGLMRSLKGVSDEAALEAVIDEMLMYAEARRYPQARPTEAEESAAVESLGRVADPALRRPDLVRVARRQATIVKYVNLRFRPLVQVSDEAVKAAYQTQTAGGARPAPSFEAAAPELRQQLMARELDARIEEWAQKLRSAADIRYVGPAAEPRP